MRRAKLLTLSKKIIASLCLSGISCSILAAGFQLNEQSTSGLGRAFSGDAAIADNAAAIARNPALGVLFEGSQISLGFSYIDPNIDIEGTATNANVPGLNLPSNSEDIAPSAIVPYGYYTKKIQDNLSFGLALNSYFGLKTNYDDSFASLDLANEAEITAIYVTPSIAWQVDELFLIGVGLNLVDVEAKISSSFAPYQQAPPLSLSGNVLALEGEDNSYGWHFGMAWLISDSFTLGLSHRSSIDLKLEGTSRSNANALLNDDASLNVDLPETTEMSVAYNIDSNWMVSFTAALTGWRKFQGLVANLNNGASIAISDAQWQDSKRYALGMTYTGCEKWALRAGIAKDESATDVESRRLAIPDTDRNWFSFGATYFINQQSNVDLGVTYIKGDSVLSIDTSERTGSSFTGEQDGDVSIAAISYNRSF